MLNTKLMASLLASGVVALSTVAMSFEGENTLLNVKDYINKSSSSISQFKSNEISLANRVENLKISKSELLYQIEQLKNENGTLTDEGKALLSKVSELEDTIKSLEEQLANNNDGNSELVNENNRLNNELNKANSEIDKANKLVQELQVQLDSLSLPNPMSKQELDKLLSDDLGETEKPPFTDEELANADYVIENGQGYWTWEYTNGIESYVYINKEGNGRITTEVALADNGLITVTNDDGSVYTDKGWYTASISARPVKIVVEHDNGTVVTILVKN